MIPKISKKYHFGDRSRAAHSPRLWDYALSACRSGAFTGGGLTIVSHGWCTRHYRPQNRQRDFLSSVVRHAFPPRNVDKYSDVKSRVRIASRPHKRNRTVLSSHDVDWSRCPFSQPAYRKSRLRTDFQHCFRNVGNNVMHFRHLFVCFFSSFYRPKHRTYGTQRRKNLELK